jgi:hypothetical protein
MTRPQPFSGKGRSWGIFSFFLFALGAGLLALVIFRTAQVLPVVGAQGFLVDFDAFYLVGELVRAGQAESAYDLAVMSGIQRELVGHSAFMPWTYPPQFDLIVSVLPTLNRGMSYALFTGLTLALYLGVLAWLAGVHRLAVLIALAPPLYVGVTIGQNAFLTGGLVGLICLQMLHGRARAGWTLGLMVLKPHLGIGLAVHALAAGQWGVLGRAVVVVGLSSMAATWVLGPGIWPAFVQATGQAGVALGSGFYPLYRMPSVFAALHTLGIPAGLALFAQAVVALGVCVGVGLAVRQGKPRHQTLALACFASVLVSPYVYDYDLTVAGIGLALIMSDLSMRASLLERGLVLGLFCVAGAWGMIHALGLAGMDWDSRATISRAMVSFGAVVYSVSLILIWRILRRPASDGCDRAPVKPPLQSSI